MRKTALILMALASCAVASAVIIESEPNNTSATADVIVRGLTPWSDTGVMSFTAGGNDVDWFSIQLNAGEVFTAVTTPLTTTFTVPDTIMGLFNPTATTVLVASDDLAGPANRGSALSFNVTTTGTYLLAVTGFHNGTITTPAFYTGAHTEVGNYQLTTSIVAVPEPATMAALALGVGLIARRRRSK